MQEKIKLVLDQVRPMLQRDGGDIEYVDYLEEEKVLLVRLRGACFGCPMSTYTIKGVVEQAIKNEIPDIAEVRLVK